MQKDHRWGKYQAELLHNMDLTEEEQEIARRARNLPIPVGRRSNQVEYRQATAFEALIGWWYEHDKDKLNQILDDLPTEYKDEEMTIALTGSRSFICFGTFRNDIYSRGSILQKSNRKIHTKN